MKKAAVLLSGGIDSTTCLYLAVKEYGAANVIGVSMDYGQRHRKEMAFAKQSCENFGARHKVCGLDSVVPRTMLTDPTSVVPDISYDEIEGVSPTYVPFRNGLMLSAITSGFDGLLLREEQDSEKHDEGEVFFGAHAEDAHNWAYPDCTPEFIGAMANLIYIGTYRRIRLRTPLQWFNKADVIRFGDGLGVSWTHTWSCYKGGEIHCGTCPTCQSRRKGFKDAGVADPTLYAA